eukprot:7458169-Alexandrium_andersonii.AAC.1
MCIRDRPPHHHPPPSTVSAATVLGMPLLGKAARAQGAGRRGAGGQASKQARKQAQASRKTRKAGGDKG